MSLIQPNKIEGNLKVLVPVNITRYGNGILSLDSGIIETKEITTPAVPALTYNNIFVDFTTKNTRIQNNANIVKDIGINRIVIPLTLGGVNIGGSLAAPTNISTSFLTVNNGTPKNFTLIITNNNAAARNVRILIQNLGPQGLTAATTIFDNGVGGVVHAALSTVTYTCVPTAYPTIDSIIRINVGRSAAGIRADFISVNF